MADLARGAASGGGVAGVLTVPIRWYQRVISPMFPRRCRFYPTCSSYTVDALGKRGVAVGLILGGYRFLRCNPWARGGVDVVPRRGERWPSWDGVIDRRDPESAANSEPDST